MDKFGFPKDIPVESNVLTSLNEWTKSTEDNRRTDVVYFDFSKAFDNIPVEKLTDKLDVVCRYSLVIIWIRQFLSERKYEIKIKGQHTKVIHAFSGVPQVEVQSPILFFLCLRLSKLFNSLGIK